MNKKDVTKIFEDNNFKIIGLVRSFGGVLKELDIINESHHHFTFYILNSSPCYVFGNVNQYDSIFKDRDGNYINLFDFFSTTAEVCVNLPISKFFKVHDIFEAFLKGKLTRPIYY